MIVVRNIALLLCIVSTLCISCTGESDPRVAKIDALDAKLAHVDSIYKVVEVNADKIEDYHANAVKSLKFIQKNYMDTMPLDEAIFLSDYRADRKLLGWVRTSAHKCAVELKYSQQQIANLRADLLNNKLSDTLFNKYYDTEQKSIKELVDLANDLGVKWEKAVSRYEERNPKVQELVNDLGGF